jgi:hypothetical protein
MIRIIKGFFLSKGICKKYHDIRLSKYISHMSETKAIVIPDEVLMNKIFMIR